MVDSFPASSCPMPIMKHDTIQLAHGSGGRLSADLISKFFLPFFGNDILNRLEDQAILQVPDGRIAFTTDSFVVDPIFFPGGNIGDLAVNGTVNDICMSGAQPHCLSVAFIIEEGLAMKELHRIISAMAEAIERAQVSIVTGDTKVVDKGSCDKIFINTTGLGFIPTDVHISAGSIKAGDKIILSGTIADHGMAIMTSRESLSFETRITSDTAALNSLVACMLAASTSIRAMRDPTRGGVATTLNEFASSSQIGIKLFAERIPLLPEVRGACEILGIDPLYVANEGKLIAVAAPGEAEKILAAMRRHPLGGQATIVGEAVSLHPGMVTMETGLGVNRIV